MFNSEFVHFLLHRLTRKYSAVSNQNQWYQNGWKTTTSTNTIVIYPVQCANNNTTMNTGWIETGCLFTIAIVIIRAKWNKKNKKKNSYILHFSHMEKWKKRDIYYRFYILWLYYCTQTCFMCITFKIFFRSLFLQYFYVSMRLTIRYENCWTCSIGIACPKGSL